MHNLIAHYTGFCQDRLVTQVDLSSVEKYQKVLAEDPASKVFAPLAEAYRQLGMTKEAHEVCQKGLKLHPNFAGGRIALAQLLLDEKKFAEATKELDMAVQLDPDNIRAHALRGELFLKTREPKLALKAYKRVLFLAPNHQKAQTAVAKLESLTADEFEADAFSMKPLRQAVTDWEDSLLSPNENDTNLADTNAKKDQFIRRLVSLVDAYMTRNDLEKALESLNEGERLMGPHPEIVKRLGIIHQKELEKMVIPSTEAELTSIPDRHQRTKDRKLETLQALLKKFQRI